MEETLFYVSGAALIVAAIVASALGLRVEGFPSKLALAATTVVFAGLVGATATFAVLQAREEQKHRDAELAVEESEAAGAEEAAGGPPPGAPAPGGPPPLKGAPGGPGAVLAVSSPDDGGLSFDPDGLEAKPGKVTFEYDNPSSVVHSIAIESPEGDILGKPSDAKANALLTTTAELLPGDYVFFCTVAGHRDGGMEGDLTVE